MASVQVVSADTRWLCGCRRWTAKCEGVERKEQQGSILPFKEGCSIGGPHRMVLSVIMIADEMHGRGSYIMLY